MEKRILVPVAVALALVSVKSQADAMAAFTSVAKAVADFSDISASNASFSRKLPLPSNAPMKLLVRVDCYYANANPVDYPLPPDGSYILMQLKLRNNVNVSLEFPVRAAYDFGTSLFSPGCSGGNVQGNPKYSCPTANEVNRSVSGVPADPGFARVTDKAIAPNAILANLSTPGISPPQYNATNGAFNANDTAVVESIRFKTVGYSTNASGNNVRTIGPPFNYPANHEEFLSADVRYTYGVDHFLKIYARFGSMTNSRCGGYLTPLMLFFDDKRPQFSQTVDLQAGAFVQSLYWPEKGSAGYFLAYDRNHNGAIDGLEELFGDLHHSNGFDALRDLDTDHDGRISESDASFKELLLWNDKNADGRSSPHELSRLADRGVASIYLNFVKRGRMISSRAMLGEEALFTYRLKGVDTVRSGRVIDVWLGQAPGKDWNLTDKFESAVQDEQRQANATRRVFDLFKLDPLRVLTSQ